MPGQRGRAAGVEWAWAQVEAPSASLMSAWMPWVQLAAQDAAALHGEAAQGGSVQGEAVPVPGMPRPKELQGTKYIQTQILKASGKS